MSDPQDQSRRGFEAGGPGVPRSAANEAQRFWDEYARRTRQGGQRAEREPDPRPGSGRSEAGEQSHECVEWCPICRTADLLRASTPPEVREQLHSVQRDALVAMRALLDAYIERTGDGPQAGRQRQDSAVEDIPIE
jgi:hypothetical protein